MNKDGAMVGIAAIKDFCAVTDQATDKAAIQPEGFYGIEVMGRLTRANVREVG